MIVIIHSKWSQHFGTFESFERLSRFLKTERQQENKTTTTTTMTHPGNTFSRHRFQFQSSLSMLSLLHWFSIKVCFSAGEIIPGSEYQFKFQFSPSLSKSNETLSPRHDPRTNGATNQRSIIYTNNSLLVVIIIMITLL